MNRTFVRGIAAALLLVAGCTAPDRIDRAALVARNNPSVDGFDTLASFSVGNGRFAFTVDATGLQTFPEYYRNGVPLGTQSQWGWHSFDNPEGYRHEETLASYRFGRTHDEPYAVQDLPTARRRAAADWYRVNPHRLHLGIVGFDGFTRGEVAEIGQTLDMWEGVVRSSFTAAGQPVEVTTSCAPDEDRIAARIVAPGRFPIVFRFPYPTGQHTDDACDWTHDDLHSTRIVDEGDGYALVERTLGSTTYWVDIRWEGDAALTQSGPNRLTLAPSCDTWSFSAGFSADRPAAGAAVRTAAELEESSRSGWQRFWASGGAVDFSRCTDPRAAELERRVVLSQYLLAIQCSGDIPPQETGLTYNSWFGRPHLEMIWWHQAQFALWGRTEMLTRTLAWYRSAAPAAKAIAARQGMEGIRWMKMTDPWAGEAPSDIGSFLIWQQPHLIYMAELAYRAEPSGEFLREYYDLVQRTALFMQSFVTYDTEHDRYTLQGLIPAQETLKPAETLNPPFELAYWRYGLSVAQLWRERMGEERVAAWDEIIGKLSPLPVHEGLCLAAESAPQTYSDIRFTSDHMAVLAAVGVLPESPLVDREAMHATFDWVYAHWNWDQTWGWDFPTTAMNAVRMGEPAKAIDALLMPQRTNTYLKNGHNYQDERLRCYLPGNGGLLTAVALMCAGWDGCTTENPGFPKDGTWDVRWEGLLPMP